LVAALIIPELVVEERRARVKVAITAGQALAVVRTAPVGVFQPVKLTPLLLYLLLPVEVEVAAILTA
jgi:hypothetical protein